MVQMGCHFRTGEVGGGERTKPFSGIIINDGHFFLPFAAETGEYQFALSLPLSGGKEEREWKEEEELLRCCSPLPLRSLGHRAAFGDGRRRRRRRKKNRPQEASSSFFFLPCTKKRGGGGRKGRSCWLAIIIPATPPGDFLTGRSLARPVECGSGVVVFFSPPRV